MAGEVEERRGVDTGGGDRERRRGKRRTCVVFVLTPGEVAQRPLLTMVPPPSGTVGNSRSLCSPNPHNPSDTPGVNSCDK